MAHGGNPFETARRLEKVQAIVEVMETYGWAGDQDLLSRMGDAHWEVVTQFARMRAGKNFSLPSEETRKMVTDRIRCRLTASAAA